MREILGQSPQVKALIDMIRKVASAKTNILIFGESGTGKELVARMIHDVGPLAGKPFIPVNCGAIPENLIESEMFGHKKGSFTGAVSEKAGLFEAANGGTLFLDEVGELPLGMQVKLLRAIQERSFRKVGGTEDIKVDLRIIAATNRDLEAAVAKGTFREDLFYRLNVIMIKTPPLRDRKGDIELLAKCFLERFAKRSGSTLVGFDPEALEALTGYAWPGNVRELENVIERATTLTSGEKIGLSALPPVIAAAAKARGTISPSSAPDAVEELRIPMPNFDKGPVNLNGILDGIEKRIIGRAIEFAGGDERKAADLLGLTLKALRSREKKG